MSQLLSGLAIVVLASIMQGSFMVPMAYVKDWKWENSWTVFSVLGMILFNWIIAFSTIPHLAQVYANAELQTFAMPAVFGLCWGIGAIGFGLGIAAVGLALGYAVIMGLVLSMGAFIPMVALHPEDILAAKGLIIITGVAVMVVGIAIFGKAGIRKEKEQGENAGEITRMSKASMKLGLVICIIGGIFSCLPNVGFALSKPLVDLALELEIGANWAGNSVWTIFFTAGAVVNLAYCGYLFKKNDSFRDYAKPGFAKNLLLMAMVSIIWIGSFVIYGVGASMMGSWGPITGWSVFIALSIAVAGIWGLIQGEWVGAGKKTIKLMGVGLGILVMAIFIFAYGGTK